MGFINIVQRRYRVSEYLGLSPDICECLFFEKILEYDTLEVLSIETLHLWCVIVYEVNL